MEWNTVVQEIRDFIDADDICTILSGDSTPVVITNRLNQFNCPPAAKLATSATSKQLHLAEILIIGNCFDQIRFSEITLDMFRVLQCLERDLQDNFGNTTGSTTTGSGLRHQKSLENGADADPIGPPPLREPASPHCSNPHKYLLYKPSFSQFNSFMSAGFKDLPSNGVLLLYLSADGIRAMSKPPNERESYLWMFLMDMLGLSPMSSANNFIDRYYDHLSVVPRFPIFDYAKTHFVFPLFRVDAPWV